MRGLLAAALIGMHAAPALASDLPAVQKLIERRDFRQALAKVNQHLALRPDSLDGRFYKGVILAESYETQQAISIFSQLIKDAPQMLEAYNNLAVLYARQHDYDQARATLEAALKVDPAFSAVTANLRNTYGRLAKQAYDKALGQESYTPGAGKSLVMLSQLRAPSPAGDKGQDQVAAKLSAALQPPVPVVVSAPAPVQVVQAPPASAPARVSAAAPTPVPAPASVAEAKKTVAAEPRKPAAAESKPQLALSAREREVKQAVEAWAEAWMRKDMKAYLAAYASDLKLPGKLSRKEWERERTKRIKDRKDSIQITLDKLDIEIQDGVATARFLQRYKSGRLVESTNKTLTLARQGGKWRIRSER